MQRGSSGKGELRSVMENQKRIQSHLNTASRDPLTIASPGRGHEGICEMLCLVPDLTVVELHDTHCVCWPALVGDGVSRDPEIAFSENWFDVENHRLACMMTPQGLDCFAREFVHRTEHDHKWHFHCRYRVPRWHCRLTTPANDYSELHGFDLFA